MAEFRLQKAYSMPKDEVREAAEGLARKLERDHGVHSKWSGDTVKIKGSGVDGQLSFHDGNIDVSVKMGFLASAFKGVLRSEVERYLDEHVS
ncbi:MAG: polyhydroxyalkanoic acid system family protein [Halioglobus sp.]